GLYLTSGTLSLCLLFFTEGRIIARRFYALIFTRPTTLLYNILSDLRMHGQNGRPLRLPPQPFSPVRAMPRTKKRCVKRKTSSTGRRTSIAAAICSGQLVVPNESLNSDRPTSSVRICVVLVTNSGQKKSVHVAIKAKAASVASAGAESGR